MFDNDDELELELFIDLTAVVDEITDKILEEVIEAVRHFVYVSYPPGKVYERDGEEGGFLGSWEADDALDSTYIRNVIEKRIFSNPESMTLGDYHHGDEFGQTDRRGYMDAALAEGFGWDFAPTGSFSDSGEEEDINFEERDYWTPILDMIKNGYFDGIARSVFRKHRIDCIFS